MSVYPAYPNWVPPAPTTAPSRAAIARASTKTNSTLQVAAAGARARLVYGRCQVPAMIGAVYAPTTYGVVPVGDTVSYFGLVVQAIWCLGEIDAIEAVTVNDKIAAKVARSSYLANYLGTSTQTADPLMAAAIPDYTDTCRGTVLGKDVSLAYSALTLYGGTFGRISAIVRGRACYDPRTTSSAYTTNPALQLADLLDYCGETVDWTSVEDAADYCDEDVGGQARWSCSISFDGAQSPADAAETLRTYAHCMLARGSSGIMLIPDAPATASASLTASDVVGESFSLRKRSRRERPSVVAVYYTKPETDLALAWGTRNRAEAVAADVLAGDLAWRESTLTLPGIQSYGEAYRFAVERLNALRLRDLEGECTLFDEHLELQVGDVVTLTHPIGLTAKAVRVVGLAATEAGRYRLTWEEYDAAVYSDATESEPSTPDTGLPDPYDVPVPTDLAVSEEVYQRQDGSFASRLRVTWSADDYAYDHTYKVDVTVAGSLVWSATPIDAEFVTGAVQEGVQYQVSVAIVASFGVTGDPATELVTAQGRQLPPGDVSSIMGFEVGGQVRLSWLAAVDVDVRWYEIRRLISTSVTGTDATDWAAAELIDRFDGLRATVLDTPEGSYRFFVRAIDSVGNYSAASAYVDLDVTLDTRAYFVGEEVLAYSSGDSTNIYQLGDGRCITQVGSTDVDTLFPNAADTYSDPFFAYDDASASEWVSAAWDVGAEYSGTWKMDASTISALVGTVTVYLELSTNGSTWSSYAVAAKVGTARYARVRAACASGSSLLVGGDVTVRLDVVAIEESGSDTSSASAATTVTLERTYTFAKAISVTASGTSGLIAVVDNVDPGSGTFDVYVFNAAGSQVAADFYWRFLGV